MERCFQRIPVAGEAMVKMLGQQLIAGIYKSTMFGDGLPLAVDRHI